MVKVDLVRIIAAACSGENDAVNTLVDRVLENEQDANMYFMKLKERDETVKALQLDNSILSEDCKRLSETVDGLKHQIDSMQKLRKPTISGNCLKPETFSDNSKMHVDNK